LRGLVSPIEICHTMKLSGIFLCVLCLVAGERTARSIECPDARLSFDVPSEIRAFYRNPDGSCVQCSLGMCGVSQNVPNAATLLWDTEYGSRERGGSGPSRVANYSRKRGLRIYNITGRQTYDWLRWAYRNGRPAAIGAAPVHFQTGCGCHPKEGDATWYVCDNNRTGTIAEYSQKGFERLHESSGTWIVILDYPPTPPRPVIVAWWQ
jgi:hypothetical protein